MSGMKNVFFVLMLVFFTLASCTEMQNQPRYPGEHYALTSAELRKLTEREKRGDAKAGERLYLYYALFRRDGVAARKYEKYVIFRR